ncbi:hypothetical protein BDV29DRAFT_161356 [Aspergillus leporis]|uniref:Uncharacterized protein n=1 Tax=Aspergillus leporis TaxID=41062 RepID=A0A5N5WP90_9EURO|nr:hypothetical protein BDV29DRAFT_161356 [Aspergillus leporis]
MSTWQEGGRESSSINNQKKARRLVSPSRPAWNEFIKAVQNTGGESVPQSTILDLKTRSFRRKDDDILGEEVPRLWLSQILNFILAFHEYGVFNDIRVQNMREDVKYWERKNEDKLGQFAALLRYHMWILWTLRLLIVLKVMWR